MMDAGALSMGALVAAQVASGGAEIGAAPALEPVADFSVMAMFARATWVVQVVMVLLVAASFWSWAVMAAKAMGLRRIAAQTRRFEGQFWSGSSIDDLYARIGETPRTAIERVFAAGMGEWRRSIGASGAILPGTEARVDRAMSVAIAREAERMQKRLPFLATVGSVSPFVGLFATVWGIKHSFESIAIAQNTNLAVVAPGIAEALLATALGLLAAIPATVAYNRLSAEAGSQAAALENFADEFVTILAREIDRSRSEPPARAMPAMGAA